MDSKYVYLAVAVLVGLGVSAFIFWPLFTGGDTEIRIFVRVFLVLFAINTFAILRLYNSIVQNTRFTIKLREALIKFQQSVPALERALKTLTSTLSSTKNSMDSLRKSTSDNTDKIEKLIEKIKRHA